MTKPLKIALGDLRHRTIGRHVVLMPLGIGLLAAQAIEALGDAVEVRLFEDPDRLLEEIENWRPDVIGLANYLWNASLNRMVLEYAAEVSPGVIRVVGGPEFPVEPEECEAYLRSRPEIDLYVYHEGELPFVEILRQILDGKGRDELRALPMQGVMSLHADSGTLVFGGRAPRNHDLDAIASPYLTGIMDQWFNGTYEPAVQTTRGCPFSCGYCRAGSEHYSDLVHFNMQRVKDELTYIAKKMQQWPLICLNVVDSNFGITERDVEIAEHIRSLQGQYGWPMRINVDTSKSNVERVLRIADILHNKIYVGCALQSLNPTTLTIIRRKNISLERFKSTLVSLRRQGLSAGTELIVPLPGETKSSFFHTIREIMDAGVSQITPFTFMLLKGTAIGTPEARNKYGYLTKYRIIPMQFGQYRDRKVIEVEEVCVATSTLSFQDYLECRALALVSKIFSSVQYDILFRLLKELNVDFYTFVISLMETLSCDPGPAGKVYRAYLRETEEELWPSPEALREAFSRPEKYAQLERRELGDNLLSKYIYKAYVDEFVSFVDVAFDVLRRLASHIDARWSLILTDIREWMVASRDISNILEDMRKEIIVETSLDVDGWMKDGNNEKNLASYVGQTKYRLHRSPEFIGEVIENNQNLFGGDRAVFLRRYLAESGVANLWRHCERI